VPIRKTPLPVDELLPELQRALQQHSCLVLEAPPGAGKTTRVPAALLAWLGGQVLVLEPRRIAARMAARRVAFEMGEDVGHTVGYQVRFEDVSSAQTRLRFVTEGVLTRRLISDPDLHGIEAVVLDEFHERHLDGDLALALLRRLQQRRPELKLIVMSATLDAAPIAQFLGGCPILRSHGRLFDTIIRHLPYSPKPLEAQMAEALELLLRAGHKGDILAFLPGSAEIRRAERACAPIARRTNLLVLPLHGSLTPAEQDRALAPAAQQKLILATNVAESSITVEGVTAVIDSGLARIATHSPWSGLPTLHIGRISQASARQRAGRAGRTAPGTVLRLYPEEDYLRRPATDEPEIAREDLSQLLLTLRAMGIASPAALDWLDAPPPEAVEHAARVLDLLGATGEMAAKLARFPLPPRLARILVEADARGVGEDGCLAAAVLSVGAASGGSTSIDLHVRMESTLDPQTRQLVTQLKRIARPRKQLAHDDDALLISVLTGFPDRVAKLRAGKQVLLSNGGSAELANEPSSDAPPYPFFTAVEAEDRRDKPLPLIRLTARVEPEWLLELFPARVREHDVLEWNARAERVEQVSALYYDEMLLDEHRGAPKDAEAAATMLGEKAIEAGIARFTDLAVLDELIIRAEMASLASPTPEGQPSPILVSALRQLCQGLRSFAELQRAAENLPTLVEQQLGARRLQEFAPAKVRLAGGRWTRVHYEHGKPPWIASRLQDFFGMKETPRVGPERTPMVVHLLAPNQRAVQTTSDLAGFWERLYPQVRRELMRRYPRHQWPEKP